MAAKRWAIRDVGRVWASVRLCRWFSETDPANAGMTLAKAFEAEPQLPEIYEADEEVKALIDMARKLEGVTRNAGSRTVGWVSRRPKLPILRRFLR